MRDLRKRSRDSGIDRGHPSRSRREHEAIALARVVKWVSSRTDTMTATTAKIFAITLFGTLALGLVGCGGAAWQVRRGAWSGELALHGTAVEAHHAAEDAMLSHCGGRARIVQGAEAERAAIADSSAIPPREVTVDHGGHRLHYVCVSRAPIGFNGRPSAPAEATASVRPRASGL